MHLLRWHHTLLTTQTHTLHVKVTLLTVLPTDKAVMKSCNKAVRKIHTEQRHTSHDPHTHFLSVSLFHLCEGKTSSRSWTTSTSSFSDRQDKRDVMTSLSRVCVTQSVISIKKDLYGTQNTQRHPVVCFHINVCSGRKKLFFHGELTSAAAR